MRILIAESNPVTRTRLREIVATQPDWESREAATAQDALQLLETSEFEPDLLIADFSLPEAGAAPLIEQLKAQPRFQPLIVLLAAAVKDRLEIQRYSHLPVQGRLLKPYHGDRLLGTLQHHAAVVRQREEERRERERIEREARERAEAEERARREAEERAAAEAAARERAEQEARERAERERLEALERARLQAEQEARERAEAEERARREAAERAAAEAAARERAEQEARERAERERREAEERAERQRKEAEAKAKASIILVPPAETMARLNIGEPEYRQVLDTILEELTTGVNTLRELLVGNKNADGRQKLIAMKATCEVVGANHFIASIEKHLLSEPGKDRIQTLEDFDNELRLLREARQRLSPSPATRGSTAPVATPLGPTAPLATTTMDAIHTAAPVAPVPATQPLQANESLPTPEPPPAAEPPPASTAMTTPPAPAPSILTLLPSAEQDRLNAIIASAKEQGYEVSPEQAIRALIKAIDPAQVPLMEFYNVLMEDYQPATP